MPEPGPGRERNSNEGTMARHGKWRVFAQHECLHLVGPCYAGDHIVAAMNMDVCPKCGEPCSLNYRDTWARVVRRRVSDAGPASP